MLKKKLNSKFWPVLVLTVVCLICSGLLALTNVITSPARQAQAELSILASKQKVFPEASDFVTIEIPEQYQDTVKSVEEAFDADGNSLGYLILAESQGYGGLIGSYVGISLSGEIIGADMPANDETPGLGQKVRNLDFYGQILGHPSNSRFSVDDSGSVSSDQTLVTIDSVTSATISSKAFIENINTSLDLYEDLVSLQGKE